MQKPTSKLESPGSLQKIKVLFSHPNRRVHEAVVPVLRDFLCRELGREVEVLSKYTSWETLCAATDNVFDLVILSRAYAVKDLSTQELSAKIKALDQSISIIVFAETEEVNSNKIDGYFPLPKCRQDLKPLTEYFRPFHRKH